jgi:cell division protein FtsI (penicillin-binding protein 3)
MIARLVHPEAAAEPPRIRLEGVHKQALETGRTRLLVAGALFAVAFLVIGGRVVDLTAFKAPGGVRLARGGDPPPAAVVTRAPIVDRNGVILATSLPTASLYANPRAVLDADEAADKLGTVFPDLDRNEAAARLRSGKSFVWLRRNLTPQQQYEVNRLGLPGLGFEKAERRIYPHGPLAAHVVGLTDLDGRGIAGVERFFDEGLNGGAAALELSIDIRLQAILRDEIAAAVARHDAIGGAGLVLDAGTGEVLAMVSLPDYDPNLPATAAGDALFNRVTKGVYEMGSTFKLFTAATALDSGAARLSDSFDAREPIRIARFTISDYHAQRRWLTVPEILVHSSNVGAAKMALDAGTEAQRDYLGRLGMLKAPSIELPEVGAPLVPGRWREINTMTIAFGHGIAVSPLQLATGVAALVNGGIMRPATLMKAGGEGPGAGGRVIKEETSRQMRELMRLVVKSGTGKKADAAGYQVGGKTGTAEKIVGGNYREKARLSSFVGAFPMEAPRFVVLAILDEPKASAETRGYATGGWVAAPVVGRLVERLATFAGIPPTGDEAGSRRDPLFVAAGGGPPGAGERRLAAN